MALVSWTMDYASAKSLQGGAVTEIIAFLNHFYNAANYSVHPPVFFCFCCYCILQPINGCIGSWREMWHSSTSPGLHIPWFLSCLPRSFVTWFPHRPSVSTPSPVSLYYPLSLCFILFLAFFSLILSVVKLWHHNFSFLFVYIYYTAFSSLPFLKCRFWYSWAENHPERCGLKRISHP